MGYAPSLQLVVLVLVQIHFESATSSKTQKSQKGPVQSSALQSAQVRHCKQVAITDPLISLFGMMCIKSPPVMGGEWYGCSGLQHYMPNHIG